MVTPALEHALETEPLCYITTWDAKGKPGTVEIWFTWVDRKLYISTGGESLKVRKLRVTPRARVTIGSRKGPWVEGPVRILKDQATAERVAPAFLKKYKGKWETWKSTEDFVRRNVHEKSVLLECSVEKWADGPHP